MGIEYIAVIAEDDYKPAVMSDCGQRRQSMLEPVAGGALGGRDLAFSHQGGDFAPQTNGVRIAAHGGEVEPFVRRYVVGRQLDTGRKHHTEPEEHVLRSFTDAAVLDRSKFLSSHDGLPDR